MRLKKSHEGLCRFLTGRGSWSNPLASTTVFETLRARRDENLQALAAACFGGPGASASGVEENEEDPMALLGIDEPEAFDPVQKGPSRSIKRMRKGVALQHLSATISVGFEPGCEFLVLSETGSSVPAIELTASSLWNLYRLVNADLEAVVKPPRGAKASRQSGAADREPRGSEGQREYWDGKKQRWVQKILGDNKKYRVLTRRGTPCGDGDGALGGSEMTDAVEEPEPSQPSCALAGSEMTDAADEPSQPSPGMMPGSE